LVENRKHIENAVQAAICHVMLNYHAPQKATGNMQPMNNGQLTMSNEKYSRQPTVRSWRSTGSN
jgi:hypothetical protein